MRRLFAISTILAGCTHHRPIANVSEVAGDVVQVETTSGEKLTVYAQAQDGGILLRDTAGSYVPGSSVVRVVDKRRARGALEGFLIGGGAGAAVGMLLGASGGDDQCHDYCILQLSAGDKALIGGFMLGSLGAFVGLVAGQILGSDFVYFRF